MPENLLCYGDNANFLRDKDLFPDESVDLIYLDPPFNSKRPYNILFKDHKGTPSAAQIKAFDDTWKWDEAAQSNYEYIVTRPNFAPDALKALMDTFGKFLGHSEMFAYLVQMATRLVMMHRVLKKTGSLYLHCDPTASHYLKLVLDAIFGARSFRREVIWRSGWVSGFKTATHNWIRNHDILLYYLKDDRSDFTFNKDLAYRPHEKGYKRRGGGGNPKGVAIDDVWDEVPLYSPWIKSFSKEKLGYATQKPLELLKRVVGVSSRPGDVVLDPFCGCGTTIDAVETLNREHPDEPPRTWIGIDITHLAVNLIKHRLARFEPPPTYRVVGEPESVEGARELATHDRYQFEYWALGLIGARPAASDRKKGADKGIDGTFYFIDDKKGTARTVLVQVKSGHVNAAHIRDLKGVLEREKAEMGVFITLEKPTKPMSEEAVAAGHYHSDHWGKDYPRIQILTVEELLNDPDHPHPRCLRTPERVLRETFKEAPKHKKKGPRQLGLKSHD